MSGTSLDRRLQERPRFLDIVRVVKLPDAVRGYTEGTDKVARAPAVGDVGVVCDVPPDPHAPVAVECIHESGYTVWIADFFPAELELIGRSA